MRAAVFGVVGKDEWRVTSKIKKCYSNSQLLTDSHLTVMCTMRSHDASGNTVVTCKASSHYVTRILGLQDFCVTLYIPFFMKGDQNLKINVFRLNFKNSCILLSVIDKRALFFCAPTHILKILEISFLWRWKNSRYANWEKNLQSILHNTS